MLIENSDKTIYLKSMCDLFISQIAKQDLYDKFNIFISNNIMQDYSRFDDSFTPKSDNNYAGLTILPNKNDKITILISEESFSPDIILHELCHMYDFVLFSEKFCNSNLTYVKINKYYQTLIYWSEFHVKQIDIPYLHLLLSSVSDKCCFEDFISNIKSFYYPGYTKKILSKKDNIQMRDIMWYLGEVVVCNLYDNKYNYQISNDVKLILPFDCTELYQELLLCLDFDSFSERIQNLHRIFFG